MSWRQTEVPVVPTPETVKTVRDYASGTASAFLGRSRAGVAAPGNCRRALGFLGMALALTAPWVRAQEALRQSMAGIQAAEERKKAAQTLGYYNVKVGPMAANFEADTTVVFSDNINYAENNAESDLIFRPAVASHVRWRVSELNSLTLTLGVGYSAYVRHSEFDRFFLVPGSETSFDIYSGDFWINLHDRFSVTDNAFQDPSFAAAGDYQILQNTAGVGVTWDLGRLKLTSSADLQIWEALTTGALTIDSAQSELLTLSGTYAVVPTVRVGLESSGDIVSYSWRSNSAAPSLRGDGTQWSVGPVTEIQLAQRLRLDGSVGYTLFQPGSGASIGGPSSLGGPYARFLLSHKVSNHITYWLSGERSVTFNSYSGPLEYYSVGGGSELQVVRQVKIRPSLDYQSGSFTEVLFGHFNYDWIGFRLDVSRPVTRKLAAEFGYRIYRRTSTGATSASNSGYLVNMASLSLKYQF